LPSIKIVAGYVGLYLLVRCCYLPSQIGLLGSNSVLKHTVITKRLSYLSTESHTYIMTPPVDNYSFHDFMYSLLLIIHLTAFYLLFY